MLAACERLMRLVDSVFTGRLSSRDSNQMVIFLKGYAIAFPEAGVVVVVSTTYALISVASRF
jgi:hypothetical protein